MDPNRRYMLLDGFDAPRSGERSIASVVENRLIGIIGNSLVLPVANGVHLDPRLQSRRRIGERNGGALALLQLLRHVTRCLRRTSACRPAAYSPRR